MRLRPDSLHAALTSDLRPLFPDSRLSTPSLFIRLLSAIITATLFFSSGPALFALSARQAMLPGGGGGGKGSAANLQSAGAASASLTARLAQQEQQKTQAAVSAMKALQARAHSIMAPLGIKNGLASGWLEPYAGKNAQGQLNSGFQANGTPITTSWSGAAITSANNATTVNIKQRSQNAYLYWQSFNVGPQTKLNFDQSAGGSSVGTWIAFNKVVGTANPTQILGSITAQGQVYILNQNGILFGNGAQVNTHALVASTLPINSGLSGVPLNGAEAAALNARGIVNNPDYQFLFTALPIAAGNNGPTPAFTPDAAPATGIGDVVVEQGASITAPANAANTGGLVALIGPNVKNAGSISTPNGQTILAAGLQVALLPHPSGDPSLRGLDVYVGEVSDPTVKTFAETTGTAENSGILSIPEGNATIAGATVNQLGVIDSSTSVALNGRIDLLANYNAVVNPGFKSDGSGTAPIAYQNTGAVNIGAGSVMQILPEVSSTATVTGLSLALNSVISIMGQNVDLGQGAIIEAPGAVTTAHAVSETAALSQSGQSGTSLAAGVSIQAGNWVQLGVSSQFSYTGGEVSLAPGAQINVAGSTDVQVDSAQNFLTLQLRGAELANSPLERTSSVRGVDITIDSRLTGTYNGQYWIGTPFGDVTGYAALIERTVGQLTEQGGSVAINAGGSVEMQSGSILNVSGGWTQYSGGDFSTTKLVYQGHLVDISQATPDRVYTGVYTGVDIESFAKWGVTKTFTSPLSPTKKQYEAPYIQGANGGSISIQAPIQILNGSLMGNTVTGPRQLRQTATLSTLPVSASLTLDLFAQALINNALDTVSSAVVPSVTFTSSGLSSASSLLLSPDLVSVDGFGNLSILDHDGTISLPANTTLNAGANGSVSLEAANVDIQGSVIAPGGSISLTADLAPYSVINAVALRTDITEPILDVVTSKVTGEVLAQFGMSSGGVTQVVNPDGTISSLPSDQVEHLKSGIVTVGENGSLSTDGLLVNEHLGSQKRFLPVEVNGGNISLFGYQVFLQKGGVLDVSGGALLPSSGSVSYGNAGSIRINAGQDSSIGDIHGGSLQFGSTLRGYSGSATLYTGTLGTAGTLSITAPAIQIGGSSSVPGVLNLSPDFFSQGGFGTFNLTGIGREIAGSSDFTPGIDIAPGTTIQPQVSSLFLGSSDQGPALNPVTPPSSYGAALNISLVAKGLSDPNLQAGSQLLVRGDLVMGQDASITLDPQIKSSGSGVTISTGSVALTGNTVAMMGSISVPGGAIAVSGAGKYPSNILQPIAPLVTVDLSPSANLSTEGEALLTPDPLGLRKDYGSVLSGGSIAVSGNILAEAGSVLNSSGASGVYDFLPYQLGVPGSSAAKSFMTAGVTSYQVDSSGGSIVLEGGEELYSEATLVAESGGSTASGGNLSLSSGRSYYLPTSLNPEPTDLNLAISQNENSIPEGFSSSGMAALGQALSPSGRIPEGGGHLAVSSFAKGGFDSVTLGGNVIFSGPVALTVPGSIKVATAGVLSADASVQLTASYVALGTPFQTPFVPGDPRLTAAFGSAAAPDFVPPTYGTGSLNITAQLIDVGNLSLQNIGAANLKATLGGGGTIRGDGTLDIAGNLNMTAAEIYPSTQVSFTLAAYNHDASTGSAVATGGVAGSITVIRGGSESIPLSAEGNLSLYASSITQGGVLLAPFGTITLGNDGSGTIPHDPVSGLSVPTTQNLMLTSGSMTSVSGLDPLSGKTISVPYGTSPDGTSWVDPSGTTITTAGIPGKSVTLSAENIVTQSGSQIDLQGGGAVTSRQWISGLGGTFDILGNAGNYGPSVDYSAGSLVTYQGNIWSARESSLGVAPSIGLYWTQLPQYYAIIPGYQPAFAPTGYADGVLGVGSDVGSQITIAGGAGLPAGTYTLLPASYGTQPGAYLISASTSSSPLAGSHVQPDGSAIVSGTKINGLDSSVATPKTTTLFTLLPPSVVAKRAQYNTLTAASFFSGITASISPANAGNLLFQASGSMALNGSVSGQGTTGGTGATVDINAPGNIDITPNGLGGVAGDIVLGASQLNSWSFGSLLIGGERGTTVKGQTPVTVSADNVTLESGATLSGNDIILAANEGITLDSGASIVASGSGTAPDENLAVSGDGALLRVSSDQNATDTRSLASGTTLFSGTGNIVIGSSDKLSGSALTLDSSGGASIDSSALLNSQTINLKAASIAVDFNGATESGALSSSLVLGGTVLQGINAAQAVNLTSYSTISFLGSGVLGSASLASLSLHAGEILGDNASSDSIEASTILLDNAGSSTDPSGGSPSATGGELTISGSVLQLGSGALSLGGFQNTKANFSGGLEGVKTASTTSSSTGTAVPGTLALGGNLEINTPVLTGAASSSTTVETAAGTIKIASAGSSVLTPGLGASLKLKATSVQVEAPIDLPSGSVAIEATTGNLNVSSQINVAGVSKSYFNVTEFTDGGKISLSSDNGSIDLAAGSLLSLNAPDLGGSAGSLLLSASHGSAILDGEINGTAPSGTGGSLTADLGSLGVYDGNQFAKLESALTSFGLTESQDIQIRSGDITVANVRVHSYTLTADNGSITVTGEINASDLSSGGTGGSITLQASGSVVLESGSLLTTQADTDDAAGKGGSVFLSAGNEIDGSINPNAVLDLKAGSTINLGVTAAATSLQDFGGTLHLRAPVVVDANGDATGIQVGSLSSKILGASSIALEGYMLYDITGDPGNAGDIQTSVPVIQGGIQGSQALSSQITSDIQNFYVENSQGSPGVSIGLSSQFAAELVAANPQNTGIAQIFNLAPGVEIINQNSSTGLVLNSDWDLSSLRAGANNAPGFLTLRTPGSITFNASLSDGFAGANGQLGSVYNADLLTQNTALPANFQSWAYQITAGADLDSASLQAVTSASVGDVKLGIPYAGGGVNVSPTGINDAQTSQALSGAGYNYYQVIRSGTGDISIDASGDLQLWNQFASIYTAGVQVTPEEATLDGTFDTPNPSFKGQDASILGSKQQGTKGYAAQFSYAGGNIVVHVGGNIEQLTHDLNGNTIADSTGELPSNWLYRRGALDPTGDTFLTTTIPVKEVASTAWWVDFSNFFDDFGALGGGNIVLDASGNISNINASIPTNFRMPGHDASGNLIVAGSLPGVELGGGNLAVNAGNNIDAGVYYVEKGNGSLNAGGSIITNPTRDPNNPVITSSPIPGADSPLAYLPTTLFLGKGNFDVQAGGDLLLGPVANVFLSPQGINNSFWYNTYFSTYSSTDQLAVQSLGGNITFREAAATAQDSTSTPLLQLWMNGFTSPANPQNISYYQPWLRLIEPTLSSSLGTLLSLAPPSLSATALSGDITFQGDYTAFPSSTGNIALIASGNINGLTANGGNLWASSQINLSDANPASIPQVYNPLSIRSQFDDSVNTASQGSMAGYIQSIGFDASGIQSHFAESGSYTGNYGVLQTKELLHDSSLLHASDAVPLQFFALNGGISGLTLFSPKQAEISAGGDITDVGLYIQNTTVNDVSIVSAGGNIIAYDPTSSLQNQAQSETGFSGPLESGDIQISGPGTLEVLAGGNVDLGNGPNNSDGTGVGITSIGNSRNPALGSLPGADIIVSAGVRLPTGLASEGGLTLQKFADTVLSGPEGATYLSELTQTMTYSGDPLSVTITAESFAPGSSQLTDEEKAKLELQLFYIVLRDTGRNHNDPSSPGYGNYKSGEQAIESFFGSSTGNGDVITWFRSIETVNGGNINLFAPGGALTLTTTASDDSLTPPGIITEGGGGINIYTQNDVSIGIGRIFTLKGGDIMIWSDNGNIAAGASSKTVQSAPPTQVLIDPTSGNVETDLAGLATGGGIGVLETVADVPPGNVDLIAPNGVIDAGDAGIRSSGNLNLAATKILNADNISASGTTAGAPPAAPPPAAPNISGATAGSAAAAANNAAAQSAQTNNNNQSLPEDLPSIIDVEVLGYGGGDGSDSSTPTTSTGSSVPPQASL